MWTYLLLAAALLLGGGFVNAEEPIGLWRDTFDHERKLAFGPIKHRDASETKRYLWLEGEHRGAVPQPVDPALTADAPAAAPIETVSISEVVPKAQPRKRKTSPPHSSSRRTRSRKSTVPIDEWLTKSRDAYNSGRLEEARRYYGLAAKADPTSTEAIERLREIDAQMN